MLAHPLERTFERLIPRLERRAEMRHCVDLACVVRRRHWRFTRAYVLDLSADGMLLSFEGWLDTGVELDVSFKAAMPAMWFDTHATVTRVVHDRRTRDSGRAVGLRFDSLSAVSHLILRGHLQNSPRPPSLREPRRAAVANRQDYASIVRNILAEPPR
jgi:c-di-GMP-binding flagellar brake protein YcgR